MQILKNSFKLLLLCSSLVFTISSCNKVSSSSTSITGDWARSSEFEGVSRTEAVTFTIGNNVYIGGGFDGTNRLADFWMYDQTTQTWFRKKDFPGTLRNSAVAFALNGKGYVGTGSDGLNPLKDFWQYDPVGDTWTQVADFGGTARYGAVAFSVNGKGYVCSGYDGTYLKDLWQYNDTTNTWTQKPSLSGDKRMDAVAFVYNNNAYVVTGINNGSYLNDFWMYDPIANAWTEKRKITNVSTDSYDDAYGNNITRSNAAVFIMNSKAYLTTGNYNGILGTTWEYDIANDVWAQKTNFEGPTREGAVGFSINNRGYVTTGGNSTTVYDDLWEFLPNNAETTDNN